MQVIKMDVIVKAGQSALDLAIIKTGTIEAAFEVAMASGSPIHASLDPGQVVTFDFNINNKKVVDTISRKSLSLATYRQESDGGIT